MSETQGRPDVFRWVEALGPLVGMLVIAGVAWGSLDSRLGAVEQQIGKLIELQAVIVRIDGSMKSLTDSFEQERRIMQLERREELAPVTGQLSALDARITRLESSLEQVWPRLRAHGENIALMREKMIEIHPGTAVPLKSPERF